MPDLIQPLLLHQPHRFGKADEGILYDVIGMTGADESSGAIEVDALKDERLPERAALRAVFRVKTLPRDVVD